MDVHPPQHPIHSLKDFLLHLLTITIGLLIALSLEAAVEAAHHRHLVRDAHEHLRREIEENHNLYAKNSQELQSNRSQLARDIEQLRELRKGKALANPALRWAWAWDSYADAAWKTAQESGAAPYMDQGWISTYTWVYAQQQYVNSTALALMNEETRASAPLRAAENPSKLGAGEIQTLLVKSAEIDLSFETLETTMKALDDMYLDALKRP
ncbi:MAG: hypothetical protein ABSF94_15130 [Steroidobacteraceae bacterium]